MFKVQVLDGGWYDLKSSDGDAYRVDLHATRQEAEAEASDYADSVEQGCEGGRPIVRVVPSDHPEDWTPY